MVIDSEKTKEKNSRGIWNQKGRSMEIKYQDRDGRIWMGLFRGDRRREEI